METETKEIIRAQYEKLPEDIKKAILSADLPTRFQNLTQKHALLLDQAGNMEIETVLVMLGLEHPNSFVVNLKKALNIPEEKARDIGQDINTEIFRPIRESLKKIHGIGDGEETAYESPALNPEKNRTFEEESEPGAGDREQILKDIEEPAAIKPLGIIETKLSMPVVLQKREVELVEKEPPKTPPVPIKDYSTDPYRESVD